MLTRPDAPKRRVRCAFTLIEVLAIVVILAMTACMGLVGLSHVETERRFDRLAFEWRELDAMTRIRASQGHSEAALVVDDRSLRAEVVGDEPAPTVFFPRGYAVRIEVHGASQRRIKFDARGCTPDYAVTVRGDDRVRRWRVFGQTGWFEANRKEDQP